MAAPLVAGAAALVRQVHPDWTAAQIKAVLMNTAVPMRDAAGNRYGESRVGAGRVQPDAAVASTLLAYADDDSGRISVSFGALLITNVYRDSRSIRVVNHGTNEVDLEVSVTPTIVRGGFDLVPRTTSLRVPALGHIVAAFDLSIDPSRLDVSLDPTAESAPRGKVRHFPNEASGQIQFKSASGMIHVPYYAQVRLGADWRSESRLIRPSSSTYSEEVIDLPLRFRGFSTHTHPVVSAFELGMTSISLNSTDPARVAADLLAVGAATDAALQTDPSQTTLYFGLATAGPWTVPVPDSPRLEVAIDTDWDGRPDYIIANGNSGSPDVLESTVTPTGGPSLPGLPINVERPDRLDTAAFNNDVLILPVRATSIGLSINNTAFRYKVQTRSLPLNFLEVDATDWIIFDPAHPIVDTVLHSPYRSPLFQDGQEIRIRLDRRAAGAAQVSTPGILLLHHFNPAGRRHEIVRIDDSGYQPVWILPATTSLSGNPVRFGFQYSGPAGLPMVVERSADLLTWEVVRAGRFVEGPTPFTAPEEPTGGSGFYRIRIQ